jgi:hypothetical protein
MGMNQELTLKGCTRGKASPPPPRLTRRYHTAAGVEEEVHKVVKAECLPGIQPRGGAGGHGQHQRS